MSLLSKPLVNMARARGIGKKAIAKPAGGIPAPTPLSTPKQGTAINAWGKPAAPKNIKLGLPSPNSKSTKSKSVLGGIFQTPKQKQRAANQQLKFYKKLDKNPAKAASYSNKLIKKQQAKKLGIKKSGER